MLEYFIINEGDNGSYEILGNGMDKSLFILKLGDLNLHREKLETIIKALGLDAKKDALIMTLKDDNYTSIFKVLEKYGIVRVISFGIELNALFPNINVPDYNVISSESYSWLPAPELNIILSDQGEKLKLWNALKEQFKLNK